MSQPVARERFAIGDRVRMTEYAREKNIVRRSAPWPILGTVSGYSRSSWCIAVLRDGLKMPAVYHMAFWEPER